MLKKFIHNFLVALLITVIVMVVAVAAAPIFVRQEQVKSFIEKHVTLPDGDKLQLDGDVKFGFLPKIYFKAPKAHVIKSNGNEAVYDNVYIGFLAHDLVGRSIKFEIAFNKDDLQVDGTIYLANRNALINLGTTDVEVKTEKPVPAKITGSLTRNKDSYELNKFTITHKSTTATGDLKIKNEASNSFAVELNTNIKTTDIDDIRRLVDFAKYNDQFSTFSGNAELNLEATSKGAKFDDLKNNVNGDGNIALEKAAIHGLSLTGLFHNSENNIKQNPNEKIDIDKGAAKFTIENSVLKISEFNAVNSFASVKGDGNVDLPKQYLDLNLDIAAATIGLSAMMPVTVIGSFDNVKFLPRPDQLVEKGVKSTIDGTKVQLKNIKLQITPDNINQLKDLGRSLGINMGKNKKSQQEQQ